MLQSCKAYLKFLFSCNIGHCSSHLLVICPFSSVFFWKNKVKVFKMYDQFYDITQILFVWLFIFFFLLQMQLRCLQKYMDVSMLLQERGSIWAGGTAAYLTRKLHGRMAGYESGMTLSAGVHNLVCTEKGTKLRKLTRPYIQQVLVQMTTVRALSVACEALSTTVLLLCIKIQVYPCQKKYNQQSA